MEKMAICGVLLLLGGVCLYNTVWFQAFFLHAQFYEDIYNAPFDVTRKGETISIPLKYKYKTCHNLAIAVPDKNIFHDSNVGYGLLGYRFVSDGRVVSDGLTYAPNKRKLSLYRGITSINILVFDLPFFDVGSDLTLELEVLEPFKFLEPYKGKINCKINPDYDAKFNKCYSEDLRIVH